MPTIIRNFFIRVSAFLGQILSISIRSLKQLFSLIARLSGFTDSASFDIDEPSSAIQPRQASVQSLQNQTAQNQTVAQVSSASSQKTPPRARDNSARSSSARNNTSGGNMDYFRNMARQIKTPQ